MTKSLLNKMFSLESKTVVLTGAGGTLVGEMATTASQCGAQTVILDLSGDTAKRIAGTIKKKGGEVMTLQCDVVNQYSLEKCCVKILDRYGKIDCLVNGGGGNKVEATTSDDLSFFDIPV